MQLILFILIVLPLSIGGFLKPIVGLMGMLLALSLEFMFRDVLPGSLSLGRIIGATAFAGWVMRDGGHGLMRMLHMQILVPILMFFVVVFFGAILAVDPLAAVRQGIQVALLFLLALMVVDVVRTRNDIISVIVCIAIASAVGALAAVYQHHQFGLGGSVIGGVHVTRAGARFAGVHPNPNSLGIQIMTAMPFAVSLLYAARTFRLRMIMLGVVGVGGLALVLTVSRSTLFPFAIFLLVTYVLRRMHKRPSTWENILVLVAVLALFVGFRMGGEYAQDRIMRGVQHLDEDTSWQARMRFLRDGFSIVLNNPITGVGLMNSTYHRATPADSHDTVSTLVGETGVSGTLLFLVFCFSVLKRQRSVMRRARAMHDPLIKELTIGLAGALVVLAVWVPVKIILYQRLFWLWVGFVLWMDLHLPRIVRARYGQRGLL